MTIQIEILAEDADSVSAAFYYVVPANLYLPRSADPNRQPAGNALSTQELADLKSGMLYEVLHTVSATGLDADARRAKLVTTWNAGKTVAKTQYIAKYTSTGNYYDGSWH